jgi:predicted RNA-binding protein with PUA-like domain
MKAGDSVLFYHSMSERAVVGIAKVDREAYPDPTSDDPKWLAVDLIAARDFKDPVSLDQIKKDSRLQNIPLLRQSRLSVMPLQAEEFEVLLSLGN